MGERKYSHVVVIVVDGAGAFIKEADTPNFDRIFKDGAVTYSAISSLPTISAECYGSMLLGVDPAIHRLTNEIVDKKSYPLDSKFPSLFRRIRNAYPDAELGSYCQWDPITRGIVESDVGVSNATARDTELTPVICDYIKEKKPDFLFVQMDSVDGAGHNHGYGSPEYLQRIHEVDVLINDIHEAVNEAGIADDTLFVVLADHGGEGYNHGGRSETELYVTFAVKGKGVEKGEIENINIRDLAAMVLYVFGIEAPEFDEAGWTAQLPHGIWKETDGGEYRDISHITGAPPRISRVAHTSELV